MNFLATVAARAAVNNDIQSIIARPNLELTPKVANISQIHLVLSQRWGTLMLYGAKPRTGFYALQFSFAHGYPEFELIPLEDMVLTRDADEQMAVKAATPLPQVRRRDVRADFFDTVTASMVGAKREVIT
jgi:hypothetical protein